MKSLKSFIKQVLAEAISEDPVYKAKIKSLFEAWINKFSEMYINHRDKNYPNAWTAAPLLYADDFQHQYIKIYFSDAVYRGNAIAFEHEGSIYLSNDAALALAWSNAFPLFAIAPARARGVDEVEEWYKDNLLFKLSISDFEIAMSVADNYEEFLALCKQMNIKHE